MGYLLYLPLVWDEWVDVVLNRFLDRGTLGSSMTLVKPSFFVPIAMMALQPSLCFGAVPAGAIELDRGTYLDQLEGFWVGQCIANWTGLLTEGRRTEPPFYTDADWPMTFDGRALAFVTDQDPWQADDDTDIEYVYGSLMTEHGTPMLSASQIQNGWVEHINSFIWVSNAKARILMDRGVEPPMTALPSANGSFLMIDAQLTTEYFGAVAPGMPSVALDLAELPIGTTAGGHAQHAAQFFVVLHSLGAVRGQGALNAAGIEQLVEDAQGYIPATSKAYDIIETVLTDYQANPDKSDWERTRDLVADRYQTNAATNGFRYLNWFESSVNFGSALVCLLYGEGDFQETVRIGTLTGWDSDNPTATMGGLVGMMLGADGLRDVFAGSTLSDRYWISRTRDGMTDYLPMDQDAEDLFTLFAQRQLRSVDRAVRMGGGVANTAGWLIPAHPTADHTIHNPASRSGLRSANVHANEMGTPPIATTSLIDDPVSNIGSSLPIRFANGIEHDPSGRDYLSSLDFQFFWTKGSSPDMNGEVALEVYYPQPVSAHTLRFIEGDHFVDGGWFDDLRFEIRINGVWTPVSRGDEHSLDETIPFERIDYVLDQVTLIDGVRVQGQAGGSASYITASELDVLSAPVERPEYGWDINQDGVVDVEDLYSFNDSPIDMNQDGMIEDIDKKLLEQAVRWMELEEIRGIR
jgi:ADP-ribosylglycohydrolase